MNTPRDWADEKASRIYAAYMAALSLGEPFNIIDEYAAALRVQPGHVRDDKGVDYPLAGVLPMSEDGWVLGTGAQVWEIINSRDGISLGLGQWRSHSDDEWNTDDDLAKWGRGYYVDREKARAAAETAREGSNGQA